MKWFLGIAVLLALGLVFHLNLLVFAMYVLGGVLLLGRFLARSWTENLVARRLPVDEVCEIGSSIRLVVKLENRGLLSVPWILLEDSVPLAALQASRRSLQMNGSWLALTRLAPGETKTVFDYDAKFLLRGYYQFGPLLVETGDVFGLHRRYRLLTEPEFVLVLPKVLPLQGYNLASRRPIGEIRVAHRLFEDPARLAGVRLFQQGDPLNRIHSRATDRIREEGWSGEFLNRSVARQQATSLAENTRMRPVVVPTRKSSDNFRRILETLARLELTDGLDFAGLVREAVVQFPRDATVVAVFSHITPEMA